MSDSEFWIHVSDVSGCGTWENNRFYSSILENELAGRLL